MADASERPSASTWSWTFQVLGVLLATATCISIAKNLGSIELYGMPAKVLGQYAWLRDSLFEPIAWALRYFGLAVPQLVKDFILAYLLVGGAFYRGALAWQRSRGVTLPWVGLPVVLTWPSSAYEISGLIRGERKSVEAARTRYPDLVESGEDNIRILQNVYWYFLMNALIVLIAATCFFAWNSLASSVGPG